MVGGGSGGSVESNLKEIKISEYFFLLLLFSSSLWRSEILIFVTDILMGLRISYLVLVLNVFGLLYGDQNF